MLQTIENTTKGKPSKSFYKVYKSQIANHRTFHFWDLTLMITSWLNFAYILFRVFPGWFACFPCFFFLAHGLRSHAMGFWGHSNSTWSLTQSILINLVIKVRLNTLLLLPLLSITFVPSAFEAYVWNILEGTSKANFFPDTSIIEMGFV